MALNDNKEDNKRFSDFEQEVLHRLRQHPINQAYLNDVRRELQGLTNVFPVRQRAGYGAFFQRLLQHMTQSVALSEGPNSIALQQIHYAREIPEQYVCPLTMHIMSDPVYVRQHPNQRFEKTWILAHLRNHANNPLTREPMNPSDLIEDSGLKTEIESFVENVISEHNQSPSRP